MDTINVLNFADAELFLKYLKELDEEHDRIYFRGQTDARWPLLPTALRGYGYKWTGVWIESFVNSHLGDYVIFSHFMRPEESVESFQLRFELALRDFIETDITYRFQVFVQEKEIATLRDNDKVQQPSPDRFQEFLSEQQIPLASQVRYVSLLAQHHGVPTRLLDWSSALDVALAFATVQPMSETPSEGRIAVWAIIHWDSAESILCEEERERKLGGVLHQVQPSGTTAGVAKASESSAEAGHDLVATERQKSQSIFVSMGKGPAPYVYAGEYHTRMEKALVGTNLELLDPVGIQDHDIYVAAQRSLAMIDITHDRCYYREGHSQTFDDRLNNSNILRNQVFKITLPYSELEHLHAITKSNPIPQAYSTPQFVNFGNIEPDSPQSDKELAKRKHIFLTEIGKRVTKAINWQG